MEFSDVVRRRRMVRRYTSEAVNPAAVERIVEHARRAPSAGFSQGQYFVVVTAQETRQRIAEAAGEAAYVAQGFDPWISSAPVHVVACIRESAYHERYAEPDKAASTPADQWQVPFWWIDGGAAMMLILLGAVDEGLAAGLLAVDVERLRSLLGMPADVVPFGVITIGHPATDRRSGSVARGRRPVDDTIRWQRW